MFASDNRDPRLVAEREACSSKSIPPSSVPDERLALLMSGQVVPSLQHFARSYPHLGWLTDGAMAMAVDSPLYWVSSDLVDLAVHASRSMPDQALLEGDAPTPSGLAFMEKPYLAPESEHGAEFDDVPVNALGWYTTTSRPGGEGRRGLSIIAFRMGTAGWCAAGVTPWAFGEHQRFDGPGVENFCDREFLVALWALSQQKRVCEPVDLPPRRPAARRIGRAGLPPESGSTRLLDVRKPSGGGGPGGSRDYSHRWIVNGHWRNQWLPSRKTHRAQWIAPYVKGPEDKPLVVREDVRVVK